MEQIFQKFYKICQIAAPTQKESKSYTDTSLNHVILGLAMKSSQHCRTAEILLKQKYLEDAWILLRCAYEATITLDYLYLFPEKKNEYLCSSDIEDYRCMAVWPKYGVINENFENEETGMTFLQELEAMKKNIELEIKNHSDIDNKFREKLAKDPESVMFEQFKLKCEARKQELKKRNFIDYLGLDVVQLQLYRYTSMLVHSRWMPILKYYFKHLKYTPENKEIHACVSIIAIMEQNVTTLYKCNILSEGEFEYFFKEFQLLRERYNIS